MSWEGGCNTLGSGCGSCGFESGCVHSLCCVFLFQHGPFAAMMVWLRLASS